MTTNGINGVTLPLVSVPTANLPSGQSSETPHEATFKRVPWNELSSVYLIRNAELGLFKLGISSDVRRRLSELQRSSAYELDLVAEWRCPKVAARGFESLLHDKLSYCRIHGEWFALDEPTLAEIEALQTWSIPMVRDHPGKVKHTRGEVV